MRASLRFRSFQRARFIAGELSRPLLRAQPRLQGRIPTAWGPCSALQRGISLIEGLVGLVIGLLGVLIISQVLAAFEGQKRTTTSATDSIESGDVALYLLEREIRMAGYGMNSSEYFGCQVEANDSTRGGAAPNIAFPLVPVTITQGAAGAPDSITLFYGNSDGYGNGAAFNAGGATNLVALNRAGIFVGDLVIAAAPGSDANLGGPPAGGNVCQLMEVTQLPTASGQGDLVYYDQSSYVNSAGTAVAPTHNPAGGMGVTFSATGTLLDMGSSPRGVTYSIVVSADGNHYQMQSADKFVNQTAAVADDVIDMQAQYGLDTGVNNGTVSHASYVAADGIVDEFVDTMPAASPTAAQWAEVLAIRVAILSRGKIKEKYAAGTHTCTTTTAVPTWGSGTAFVITTPDWGCYHYRVFQTTIPLRNVIWKQ
jgi:type IV pilus assembly protein PilW